MNARGRVSLATSLLLAAAEDRDALRALVDGFHHEDFAHDTLCVRHSPTGRLVAVITPAEPIRPGVSKYHADCVLRVWPCRDGRVVRIDGDAPLFEQRGRGCLDEAPQWSHAGDRLAFTIRPEVDRTQPDVEAWARLHVWSQEAGAREIGALHERAVELAVSSPCWSPHDDFIALAAGWYTPVDLHLFDVDGGNVLTRRLESEHDGNPRASWSPDGRWIAVATNRRVLLHDVGAGQTRKLVEYPQRAMSSGWTPPQWDATSTHLGVMVGLALTIDLRDGAVHEWKSAGHVDALAWIPGGSHWFAITDRSGPENGLARAFRVLTRECSEPPYTYSGCVADGDGRILETAFTTTLARPPSLLMDDDEECWFALPWAEAVLLRTVR